jgi:hypothetical protein
MQTLLAKLGTSDVSGMVMILMDIEKGIARGADTTRVIPVLNELSTKLRAMKASPEKAFAESFAKTRAYLQQMGMNADVDLTKVTKDAVKMIDISLGIIDGILKKGGGR